MPEGMQTTDSAGGAPHAAPRQPGHVIVCGADHLGIRTVEELQLRNETVVIVAPAGDASSELERLRDVEVVRGDQRTDRVLRAAGIEAASAVIFSSDDDLANVHAALTAHDLNPAIRIVIRLFDAEFGAHLPTLLPNAVALSSSAVAAPGFVSAALDGEGGGEFEFGGRLFTVRQAGLDRGEAGADRGDDGPVVDVLPIGRLRPDRTVDLLSGAEDLNDPSLVVVDAHAMAMRVRRSDRPGSSGSLQDGGHTHGPGSAGARPSTQQRLTHLPRRIRRMPQHVRSGVSAPDRRLVNLATVIIALAGISAVYFQLVADVNPLDALSYAFSLLTGAASA